jgi:peptidoglycan/LPS O-acetylase OafA/YrhL
MFDVQRAWETGIAVMFALLGALARLLNNKSGIKPKRYKIVSELFIAGFMGGMMILLARASGLQGDWVGLICGVSGWVGPKIMEYIVKPAEKAISALVPLKNVAGAVKIAPENDDD